MRLEELLKSSTDLATSTKVPVDLLPRDKSVSGSIHVEFANGNPCYLYSGNGTTVIRTGLRNFTKKLSAHVNLKDDWILSRKSQLAIMKAVMAMNYFLRDTLGSVQKEEGVAAAVAMSNSDEDMDKRDALRRKWIKKYGYGLSLSELSDMAKKFLNAVKTGNIRLAATVLDYLEDINYHSECAEFCNGLASMYVMK